ncbi:MAG TPA: preprotein translocase subunit SecG [Wolbachia sp.]|uniref:preprotein translocase subunit SecG n=1 Tax=Wolbachia endosymbiont of Pentalonia nigronervosa TaxID=1301914 RepID=UPI000EC5C648|nr:preprotein translocase subunit SecG [Wolbachia endosymbiont of Pentalonia nigronervosa]MBD0391070.1 preprotein translocase subunit SecG [Wolbachia endosymbiont of Pentalonia nigronervosa]HCE59247.1 preprotein translocase subunit SecG [Wolbachia sp.]
MSVMILSIFQITLVVILVTLVLLQPPGSSSLSGFSSSQQGFNSIVPIKSSANPLSKITGIVAGLFIINTLLLTGIYSKDMHKESIARKIELEKKQESEATSVPFEN